jgi:hypothetical protein
MFTRNLSSNKLPNSRALDDVKKYFFKTCVPVDCIHLIWECSKIDSKEKNFQYLLQWDSSSHGEMNFFPFLSWKTCAMMYRSMASILIILPKHLEALLLLATGSPVIATAVREVEFTFYFSFQAHVEYFFQ